MMMLEMGIELIRVPDKRKVPKHMHGVLEEGKPQAIIAKL